MAKIIDPDNLTYLVNGSPTTENVQIDTAAKTIRLLPAVLSSRQTGLQGSVCSPS
jgi:hypothetical protein